jgi:hypothetical protein
MQPKAFHSCRTIIAQWTRLDHIVLTDMLVLKMSAHRDLPLETSIAYRAMIRQGFRMRREVLGEMVLPKKSLLTYSTFVWFHACMSHLESKSGRKSEAR